MTPLLAAFATLPPALAAGWLWGHHTARIRYVLVGGTDLDEAAFLADERARFDQLIADFDQTRPDDPRSST